MNRAERRAAKKREQLPLMGENGEKIDGLGGASWMDELVTTPHEAEMIQASLCDIYTNHQRYTEASERTALRKAYTQYMQAKHDTVVVLKGIVCGVGYGYTEKGTTYKNVVNRICVMFPSIAADPEGRTFSYDDLLKDSPRPSRWDPVSSHVWLFLDRRKDNEHCASYDLRLGDTIEFACEIRPYKTKGQRRYGVGDWCLLKRDLLYSHKGKERAVPRELIQRGLIFDVKFDKELNPLSMYMGLRKDIDADIEYFEEIKPCLRVSKTESMYIPDQRKG